jgi:hypothetical protein
MEIEERIDGNDVIARYDISKRTLIDWLNAGLPATDPERREKILIRPGSFYELEERDDISSLLAGIGLGIGYPEPFSKSHYTITYRAYVESIERNVDLLLFKVSDIEAFRREHGIGPKQIGKGSRAAEKKPAKADLEHKEAGSAGSPEREILRVSYSSAAGILLKDRQEKKRTLSRPNPNSVNDNVFNLLYENQGKLFTREELSRTEIGQKSLHKIVNELGFTAKLKRLFFKVSKDAIAFKSSVTEADLQEADISLSDITSLFDKSPH